MSERGLRNLFGRARIDDRTINELVGIARGLIADGTVNEREAEFLRNWAATNREVTGNPVVNLLCARLDSMLDDDQFSEEELGELFITLSAFCAGDFELGEATKSTHLPLCEPPPQIVFPHSIFCFTGTFAFGARADCEAAVTLRGGEHGPLRKKTRYLVIGAYSTDSWAHSAFGRKIEKAVQMRNDGVPINIINEMHWAAHL